MGASEQSDGLKVYYATVQLNILREAPAPNVMHLPDLVVEWGLSSQAVECLWVVGFDATQQVRCIVEIARGNQFNVQVDISSIFDAIRAAGTNRFYVMHNHPSSGLRPTKKDLVLTQQIAMAAAISALHFEDHVILAPPDRWYSLVEHGHMTPSAEIARLVAQSASQQVWSHRR